MPSFLSPLVRTPDSAYALRNRRSGFQLAETVEPAFDSRTRNKGLLGRDGLPDGSALILAPCSSIHTWFMRFPIDVLFVDRAGVITKVRTALRPWRMSAAWGAHAVVELPSGSAGDSHVGDVLELVPNALGG